MVISSILDKEFWFTKLKMFHEMLPFVNFYMAKSWNSKKAFIFSINEILQIFLMNKVEVVLKAKLLTYFGMCEKKMCEKRYILGLLLILQFLSHIF